MPFRSSLLLCGLCVAAAACTSDELATGEQPNAPTAETTTAETSIENAIAVWAEVEPDNYLVRAIDNDQTSLDAGCTWITEVHETEIDTRWAAMFDVECGDWDVSVPALHEQLIDYSADVDQNGGQLDVQWTELGVPAQIEFAPSVGEGLSLTIEFQDLNGQPSVRADLAAARSQWSAVDGGDYRLELVELTNYWARGCRWTTVVSDGVPIEKSAESETNSNCSEIDWTVEVLFDMVSSWTDDIDQFSDPAFGEHTLIATFNDSGVPTSLIYDLANGDDEETSLQITYTPE